MRFFSKKRIRGIIKNNINLHDFSASDLDIPDLFKPKYEVLASLGPSAFYLNEYVYSNFWNIIIEVYEEIISEIDRVGEFSNIQCSIEIPIKSRISHSDYLLAIDDSFWDEIDKYFNWPRVLIQSANASQTPKYARELPVCQKMLVAKKFSALQLTRSQSNRTSSNVHDIAIFDKSVELELHRRALGYDSWVLLFVSKQ